MTEEGAEDYLTQDLEMALRATLRYCPVLATESEGRLAAGVDFTFNLGTGRQQSSARSGCGPRTGRLQDSARGGCGPRRCGGCGPRRCGGASA